KFRVTPGVAGTEDAPFSSTSEVRPTMRAAVHDVPITRIARTRLARSSLYIIASLLPIEPRGFLRFGSPRLGFRDVDETHFPPRRGAQEAAGHGRGLREGHAQLGGFRPSVPQVHAVRGARPVEPDQRAAAQIAAHRRRGELLLKGRLAGHAVVEPHLFRTQ